MTNHPKDAHISDSASGIKEETMASEIREENKVREKLRETIHAASNSEKSHPCYVCEEIADVILQSPDLRVTLVEPRYWVSDAGVEGRYYVSDRNNGVIAEFNYGFDPRKAADEYTAWLNSKEPK